MFSMDVRSNIGEAVRKLSDRRVNIPLATAKALTFTIQAVQAAEKTEMTKVFDRPTPFTLNSLYVQSATPSRLIARTWFKDLRFKAHYLVPQVEGGDRPLKRFEKFLQSKGLLPVGMFAVPGERAELDAYGNMSRGQLVKILSALQALPEAGYLANRSQRSAKRRRKQLVDYFVGRPKPAAPMGVWQRIGTTGLRPILIFVKAPHYKKRFDFYGIAVTVSNREFPLRLERALLSPSNAAMAAAA
jgi:hypothetical protein